MTLPSLPPGLAQHLGRVEEVTVALCCLLALLEDGGAVVLWGVSPGDGKGRAVVLPVWDAGTKRAAAPVALCSPVKLDSPAVGSV